MAHAEVSGSPLAVLPVPITFGRTSTPPLMSYSPKFALPYPTNSLPCSVKKSHARKQPPGHIPRPRNAFILFRCDFVRQKKIPESVENDHRNISRIVGKIWREMSEEEKKPWVTMADEEKTKHLKIHPGYRFTQGAVSRKKPKRGDDVPRETQYDEIASDEALSLALQRAASCPPGALHIPQVNLEFLNGYGNPLKTRDDLSRRPSRFTLYQSTPYDLKTEASNPAFFTDTVNQHHFAEAARQNYLAAVSEEEFATEAVSKEDYSTDEDTDGIFCGPHITDTTYLSGPHDPPEWQNTRGEPVVWSNWCDFSISNSIPLDGDTDTSRSQDSLSLFADPFASLPPLPRSGMAYLMENKDSIEKLPLDRKHSGLYSSISGWQLPPHIQGSTPAECSPNPEHLNEPYPLDVNGRQL